MPGRSSRGDCVALDLVARGIEAGKVTLEWQVTPTGSVGVVRVKYSDLRDTEVASCMQASARLWHFPSPKGGAVTVTYPFVFSTIGL